MMTVRIDVNDEKIETIYIENLGDVAGHPGRCLYRCRTLTEMAVVTHDRADGARILAMRAIRALEAQA